MALNQTFEDMLNDNLHYDLLRNEMKKDQWLFDNIEMVNDWKGGTLPVPFVSNGPSSVKLGALTAADDIAEMTTIRGEITNQPVIAGSLIFNQADVVATDGAVKKDSFLTNLADQVDIMLRNMKRNISLIATQGPRIATLTSDGTALGVAEVGRTERFQIGQKLAIGIDIGGGSKASASCYVTAISKDDGTVTVSATRGGSALNISAYTTANDAAFYLDGSVSAGDFVSGANMTSLRGSLLSAANGGSTTLYGKTKTAYPFLQATNISGAAITASNILEKIFDASYQHNLVSPGEANTVLMGAKNFASCLKVLDTQKGAFNVVVGSTKTNAYTWKEVTVLNATTGMDMTIVNAKELDDTEMYLIDKSSMKFHTNGMFRYAKNPGGQGGAPHYYEVRATTGYYWIVDIFFFGDFVVHNPEVNAVIHSISY